MLGLIHPTVLEKGSEQFKEFFFLKNNKETHRTRLQEKRRKHGKQLQDFRQRTHLNVICRSALGLTAVYNLLPAEVVSQATVKDFQIELQNLVKKRAAAGCEDWSLTLSPRVSLWRHPLK